ncbi:hypothetical protein MD588_06675 [Photobacterium sp. SDRW27]|uniref:hypothetical protein n=1 Tax=Photobacterium obscurum TaxID=2829490 RepID=UPI002244AE76|nr:hypothetical protein [Photobacterium obscurum]MCW8328490.1 hypothetical protein [Photobacterium obscurum]
MDFTHVTEIKELSEEAKAFLVYFVSQDLTNIADNLCFLPCNIPFGSKTIKYKTAFNNDLDGRLEYWIVFDKDKVTGVAQRLTYEDKFETSFIHFKLNHESDTYLKATISKMPMVIMG